METAAGSPSTTGVNIKPNTIKAAQEEMARLDVLVCGHCHEVFHFIEEFQQHRNKEGACSKESTFRENSNQIEQRAQMWAFLLWKGTQNLQESPDKDSKISWKLYQKWCHMDSHMRNCWILAGKTIQTFTKISNAKMQDVPQSGTTEGGKTVVLRKVIRNGQPDSPDKKDFICKTEPIDSKETFKLKSPVRLKKKNAEDNENVSDDEYFVEQIMAKRFNPKRKVYEYLLKWKKRNSPAHSKDHYNTWEDVAHVSRSHKGLMNDFESNLVKQKEIKDQQVAKSINKANQLGLGQKNAQADTAKAGPSTPQGGRPMRLSKSKATDKVKQWCGSMRNEETILGKRKLISSDSDSDDDISSSKRGKVETSGDDEWISDSAEDKTLIGRSDVIQRAFRKANVQSNGSRLITGSNLSNNLGANKSKVEGKPAATSTYLMHQKEGVIKLDSSPTNKLGVKGSNQSTSNMLIIRSNTPSVRKQAVPTNSLTPVHKVITKSDGSQIITQMQVVTSKSSPTMAGTLAPIKNEPIKIQPRPDPTNQMQQIHLVTTVPSSMNVQRQRVVASSTPTSKTTTIVQQVNQRPLLPRPSNMGRGATSNTNMSLVTTPARPIVRTVQQSQQRQGGNQTISLHQQKRPVVQKRILTGATLTNTLLQTSAPGLLSSIPKTKITVTNTQSKVLSKSVASPVSGQQQMKISPKVTTLAKSSKIQSPQQKMMLIKKKIEAEAGVVTKPTIRPQVRNSAVIRAKVNEQVNKAKETKLAETDGLHMQFHRDGSESSSDAEPDFPPISTEKAQPCPDSPPRQLSLCPLTGRLIGPDGKPIDPPEPEPEPPTPTPMAIVPASATLTAGTATISPDGIIATTAGGETTELVLPTLESFSDGAGGIVRVEMSPGGTTGIVVQTSEAPSTNVVMGESGTAMPGPDMPSLDDPSIEIQTTSAGQVVVNVAPISTPEVTSVAATMTDTTVVEATTIAADQSVVEAMPTSSDGTVALVPKQEESTLTSMEVDTTNGTATVKLEESPAGMIVTGEDGVLYQVAGQSGDGQTLLVAQGANGEQQFAYVTTEQGATGEEGQILSLDQAVAHLMPDQAVGTQFYVKEGTTEQTVEASEVTNAENQQLLVYNHAPEDAGDNQVVAQVISSDPPTANGNRKVVLLLPDGNLMMTEVDEEQYLALELDK